MEFKFCVGDEVIFKERKGRIEDTAIDKDGNALYLVSFQNPLTYDHWYRYIPENCLKEN